jgi:ribosomal protein S27E
LAQKKSDNSNRSTKKADRAGGGAATEMPIRFRCPNCHQLLGIARRKAGTMVHCPTCSTSVLVPNSDEAGDSPIPAPKPASTRPHPDLAPPSAPAPAIEEKPAAPANLFDRDDFDALLRPSGESMAREPAAAPRPAEPYNHAPGPVAPLPRPAAVEPPPGLPPFPPAPLPWQAGQAPAPAPPTLAPLSAAQPGLVLSPARATVLTVVVILLLAIAFGAGLIVGRFYLG